MVAVEFVVEFEKFWFQKNGDSDCFSLRIKNIACQRHPGKLGLGDEVVGTDWAEEPARHAQWLEAVECEDNCGEEQGV